MSWKEVQDKYRKDALSCLGPGASESELAAFVHGRIVDRACSTSVAFDDMASEGVARVCVRKAVEWCGGCWSRGGVRGSAKCSAGDTDGDINSTKCTASNDSSVCGCAHKTDDRQADNENDHIASVSSYDTHCNKVFQIVTITLHTVLYCTEYCVLSFMY